MLDFRAEYLGSHALLLGTSRWGRPTNQPTNLDAPSGACLTTIGGRE